MKRREFIKAGSLATAGLFASGTSGFAGYDEKYADRKLRVGVIGPGWYGKVDILRLIQVAPVEVVSVCDVNRKHAEEAASIISTRQATKKTPVIFSDYRKMIAEKNLDAVLIDTPDHWHALQMIEAVNAGLDVFVQKPIGADVVECQKMFEAARRNKRVVQVGLQRRSTPHLIEAKKKIIDSGMLGKVGQVDIFCYYGGPGYFKQEPSAPPEGFDYEMWTGPAPMLPYRETIQNGGWRYFKEYANGYVGDMAVHMFDMTRWLLDLGWPKRVSSTGGLYIKKQGIHTVPDTQTVVFDYGDLQVVWNHRNWSEYTDQKYPWGGFFYGENGLLKAGVFGYDYKKYRSNETVSADVKYELEEFPEDKTEPRIEKHVAPAVRHHMKNWLDCIADRGRPVSDIEEGMISSVSCILGNIALELNRTLEWDAETGTVKNDDEANRMLARTYRSPWKHP